jgi:hypothetical protein
MSESFAVFIATNQRPNRVDTYANLRRSGYSGRVFLVVDDGDPTLEEYRAKYGDAVLVFNKQTVAATFDLADTFHQQLGAVVFARNAIEALAKERQIDTYLMLDDDYTEFHYRFDRMGNYKGVRIKSLDRVFSALLAFHKATPAVTVCMAQGGDFIGGAQGSYGAGITLRRKAMNTFFCRADRSLQFLGRINEDVNTYVTRGTRGVLFLTVNAVSINQRTTQSNAGGMSDFYRQNGTYVKSFYTVLMAPSCVKISTMGRTDRRIHHLVLWRYAVPKIVDEKHRRSTEGQS